MKILNNVEIGSVSGGWTCKDVYYGQPFRKAVLRTNKKDHNQNVGVCYYGSSDGGELFYYSTTKLAGIVQKPINFWLYASSTAVYISYECFESASKCVFVEA